MAPTGKRAQKRKRAARFSPDASEDEWIPPTQRAHDSDFEELPSKVPLRPRANAKALKVSRHQHVSAIDRQLEAAEADCKRRNRLQRREFDEVRRQARLDEARQQALVEVGRVNEDLTNPEMERPLLWTPPATRARRETPHASNARAEAASTGAAIIEEETEYVDSDSESEPETNEQVRDNNLRVPVPSLLDRMFSDWEEFESCVEEYQKENYAVYRFRDSLSVQVHNTKHPHNQLPTSFGYSYRKCYCTLGCKQASRGEGKRTQRKNRYQGCGAFFRAKLVQVDDGDELRWAVRVVKEHRYHNHNCTKAIYAALVRGRDLADDSLLEQLDAFVATNTDTRQITDYFSSQLDLPLSSQLIRNLINARLGSGNADSRLKQIIGRFVSKEGNTCLLVQDESGLTCGIALQNAAQKEVFRRWGDTLVLDWTHNTNNLGFYMGSLIATVVTGRGVSVLDYLCVNQKKETVVAVINHFKENNSSWQSIQSVVIDKDFAEWSAIKSVFPSAKVLLCQFHMISYFRRIMGNAQYFVPLVHRNELEGLIYAMIYASSRVRYEEARLAFKFRARKISRSLAKYFEDNWNTCSEMWSNYGRQECFSGGNTTSNRIEASWNQFKQLMGKKSSIDRCVTAVIQQQACVIRQIEIELTNHEVMPPLVAHLPSQLRALGQVLSEYCLRRVQQQWDLYIAHHTKWTWSNVGATFTGSAGGRTIHVTVQPEICSCDCLFYRSTVLPCQHVFAVCNVNGSEFKVAQLHPRWSMIEAHSATSVISSCITDLVDIRARREESPDTEIDTSIELPSHKERLAYVKLKRREICEHAVLSGNEKYNIVHSELMPLITAMQALPTHLFYRRFADLRATIKAFGEKWELNLGDDGSSSDDDDDEVLNFAGADALDDHELYDSSSRKADLPATANDDDSAVFVDETAGELRQTSPHLYDDVSSRQVSGHNSPRASEVGSHAAVIDGPNGDGGVCSAGDVANKNLHDVEQLGGVLQHESVEHSDGDDSDVPFEMSYQDEPENSETQPDPEPELSLSYHFAATPASQVSLPDLSVSDLSQKLIASTSAMLARVDAAIGEDTKSNTHPVTSQLNVLSARREKGKRLLLSPARRGKGNLERLRKLMNWEQPTDFSDDEDESPDIDESEDSEYIPSQESDPTQVAQLTDRLSVIRLPRPVKQTSRGSKRRTAVVQATDCPIRIDVLVDWAVNTPNLERVGAVLQQYPVLFTELFLLQRNPIVMKRRGLQLQYLYSFVIPRALLLRVNSAIVQWLDETGTVIQEVSRGELSDEIPVAYLASELAGLSLEYIGQVKRFYEAMDATEIFKLDLAWVTIDWSRHSGTTVPFLPAVSQDPAILAQAVAQLLKTADLNSKFVVPAAIGCRPTTISLSQILGRLARGERLNDAVIHAVLQNLCRRYPGCFALDPVAVRNGLRVALPQAPLFSFRCIAIPVHLQSESHWIIQMVKIEASEVQDGKLRIRPANYDPLGIKKNMQRLADLWLEYTTPLLQFWYDRDRETKQPVAHPTLFNPSVCGTQMLSSGESSDTTVDAQPSQVAPAPDSGGAETSARMKPATGNDMLSLVASLDYEPERDDVTKPVQQDGSSCGVYCLAFADSIMRSCNIFTQQDCVGESDLEVIRLRMLAEILGKPQAASESQHRWVEISEIGKQVNKYFPAASSAKTTKR